MQTQLFQTTEKIESPKELVLKEIDPKLASHLNEMWHSRLPIIPVSNIYRNTHKICFGLFNNNEAIGVAIWTSPVAQNRFKDGKTILELRRLALSPKCPHNTATWCISKMVGKIKNKFPDLTRLISYQDTAVHKGIIYKASGWKEAKETEFSSWTTKKRIRNKDQATGKKIRWEKQLKTDKAIPK